MTDDKKLELNNELIRKALELEINALEAPPDPDKWKKVASALEKEKDFSYPNKTIFNWSRVAVAAAACLVLVVSGIGLVRNLNVTITPLADDAAVPEAADEVEVFHMDEEPAEMEIMEEDTDRTVYEGVPPVGEIDPSPPEWPETLPGDYYLSAALLLVEAGDPVYSAALYHNGSADLLLVKKDPPEKDLYGFIGHIGEHMQVAVQDVKNVNGFVRFTAGQKLGLAWQENSRNQALLVLSGEETKEELKSIAASLN